MQLVLYSNDKFMHLNIRVVRLRVSESVLEHEGTKNVPVLLFANKQDLSVSL